MKIIQGFSVLIVCLVLKTSFCSAEDCSPLNKPANGTVTLETADNSTATYSCDEGFELSGETTRQCHGNGSWTGTEPECKVKHCESLQNPPNGKVDNPETKYNSEAIYSCDQGFEMKVEPTRRCDENGNWTGEEPMCQIKHCESLKNPPNGKVDNQETKYNSVAKYSCDKDFVMIDLPTRRCDENGKWTGEEPKCQKADTTVALSPQSGNIGVDETVTCSAREGDKVYVSLVFHSKSSVHQKIRGLDAVSFTIPTAWLSNELQATCTTDVLDSSEQPHPTQATYEVVALREQLQIKPDVVEITTSDLITCKAVYIPDAVVKLVIEVSDQSLSVSGKNEVSFEVSEDWKGNQEVHVTCSAHWEQEKQSVTNKTYNKVDLIDLFLETDNLAVPEKIVCMIHSGNNTLNALLAVHVTGDKQPPLSRKGTNAVKVPVSPDWRNKQITAECTVDVDGKPVTKKNTYNVSGEKSTTTPSMKSTESKPQNTEPPKEDDADKASDNDGAKESRSNWDNFMTGAIILMAILIPCYLLYNYRQKVIDLIQRMTSKKKPGAKNYQKLMEKDSMSSDTEQEIFAKDHIF